MQSNLERIDITALSWLDNTLTAEPDISRSSLARRFCEEHNWRSANGRLQTTGCALTLQKLENHGLISLPTRRSTPLLDRTRRLPLESYERPELTCSLEALGEISLIAVNGNPQQGRIWRQMMESWHPLQNGHLCGAQIRYLIASEHGGLLGALSFSSAAWRLAARDRWIGWSDETRAQRLGLVVNNSRFLILPQVRVANLASQVLGLARRSIANDWQTLYAARPVLLETFVDPAAYRGTCYRAANWQLVGRTTGRGRQDQGDLESPKEIYLLPLQADFRQILGGCIPAWPGDWAEEEFGRTELGDQRLRQRLFQLARIFYAQPQASIPAACGDKATVKAAYRFFQHPAVSMDNLLAGHQAATADRIRRHTGVVLAAQDTTTLNYHAHPATEDLGPIDSKGTQGLMVHDTMAFTAAGVPLGLIDVQCWARPEVKGKNPVSESSKWLTSFEATTALHQTCPNQLIVSVGDREADFYDLFTKVQADGPQLLVRAMHHRKLLGSDLSVVLHLQRSPVAGTLEVQIPARGGRKARIATLDIHYDQVTLAPPGNKRHLPPMPIWAVLACEKEPPSDAEPLEWQLLTTVAVGTFEAACERVAWYTKRWGIEVFHRTLKKEGCNIEQRQLGTADRLSACLALDMVVAWRLYYISKIGQHNPDLPCTVFLSNDEWRALVAYSRKDHKPTAPPTTQEATLMIARLGGYQDRKGKSPGNTTIARGVRILSWITISWIMFQESNGPP